MKRLVLTIALIGATLGASAASVTWGSGKLYTAANANGGFSSDGIGTAATGYLFSLTASEYNGFLDDYRKNGNMSSVYSAYKNSLESATSSAKTTSRGSVATITTEADIGSTVYGALLYLYHDDTLNKDFYIANIVSGMVASDRGLSLGSLGTNYLGEASGTATSWSPVPEPTSGLLLLLGMAGLALRRKQA